MTGRPLSRKLLLLGEIGVGKTSLVRRLTLGELPTDYRPTIGVDLYTYRLPADMPEAERRVEFVIWDIDGNYGQSIFRHVYSQGASGALIIGDADRRPTLDLMVGLAEAFQKALPGRHFSFVLNKSDLVPDRTALELPEALQSPRHPVVWTSALSGDGVEPAFVTAGAEILRRTR
ncbi:MAG TPA: ADP-ribosylation factor-like protein [Hyphomicrobiaceae bacterium]|nr:ADP-ribosylation factor-like protein [Hyphomicrobiaceae bacterium]